MREYKFDDIQWPINCAPLDFRIRDRAALVCRRGSEAHGTFLGSTDPNSIDDRDVFAVVIPPVDYYLRMSKFYKRWESACEINGCWDVVAHEFRKFVSLAANQNPDMLMILWLRDTDYLVLHPAMKLLVENRHLFRKERANRTFYEYAQSQLRKMKTLAFQGYMGAKRKELVGKYGYDTKNAAHVLRLLRMGREYMLSGELHAYRGDIDAEELKAIKRGEWEFKKFEEVLAGELAAYEEAKPRSTLPPDVNHKKIDRLCLDAMSLYFDDMDREYLGFRTTWDREHDQDAACSRPGCGDPYYRHFDTYDRMAPVGCKYCGCHEFVEPGEECEPVKDPMFEPTDAADE